MVARSAATQAQSGCWVNDLYWDEELQMLYAGLSVRNNTHADGDQVYALTRAPLAAPGGALGAFVKIDGILLGGANASGPLHSGTPEAKTSVSTVFAFNGNGTPECPAAVVQKISGMRTSTNLKYLIVNAHVFATLRIDGLSNNIIPYIWAVRLSTANDGTKGNVVKNTDGTALANGWTGADLGATLVGDGPLPFIATSMQFVTQLESVGDAVFASIGSRATIAPTNNEYNKCAIYSSHALFGHAGQIIGWTPWERVFPSDDAVFGFAVDPMLGNIWQIGKNIWNDHKVVTRTQWHTVEAAINNSLASQLNHDFTQGCTAVLDIPQGTNGIGLPQENKSSSLALFGGDGIVAFARTESGGYNYAGGTNIMTTDFSDTANYKLTTLPQGAGYVRALTFSRSVEAATKGYFFAGTDTGLYVFVGNTADPKGYTGNNLALNLSTTAPFTANAGWIRMDAALAGAVTALDAIGSHLFAVEHDYSQPGSVTCRLIRYTIETDVTATVGSRAIIAASGQTTIPANTLFNYFAIVCDSGDRTHARGLLATNVGIYQSPAALDSLGADANWVLVPNTDASLLTTMIKTNKRVMAGNDGKALSPMIAYLDGSGNSWHEMYLKHLAPTWNAHAIIATTKFGYTLQGAANTATQRLVNFWTDGARRFYSEINNTNLATGDELKSCPFSPALFGMTGEETITANTTPAHIFWIENISGIGEVMVGTEFGVLSLN